MTTMCNDLLQLAAIDETHRGYLATYNSSLFCSSPMFTNEASQIVRRMDHAICCYQVNSRAIAIPTPDDSTMLVLAFPAPLAATINVCSDVSKHNISKSSCQQQRADTDLPGLAMVLSAMLAVFTEAAYEPKMVETLLLLMAVVYAATLLVSPVRKATVVPTTTEPDLMLPGTIATFTGPDNFSMFVVNVATNCKKETVCWTELA